MSEKETQEAMKEVERGEGTTFDTVEELFEDMRSLASLLHHS